MVGAIIFFLSFLFLTVRLYKKKGISSSFFIYFLYTLSGASALILLLFYDYGKNPSIGDYNSGIIFLLIALVLFLYPFYNINDYDIHFIKIPHDSILTPIIWGATLLSLFSLIYFIPIAYTMLSVGLNNIDSVRQTVALGENPFISDTIYNTIAGTGSYLYVLQICFFFIEIIRKKKITKYSVLILISSFSYPMFVLAYLGRDGVLFWAFSFISFFLLFYKYIPASINRNLIKMFVRISIPFACVFIVITIGRFAIGNDEKGFTYAIFNYLGQGPINFAELYDTGIKKWGYGQNMFSLISSEDASSEVYAMKIGEYGLVPWVFRTFVNSIYLDFGAPLTIVIALVLIVFYKITYTKSKRANALSFPVMILYILFYTIYSQGLFYFRHYNRVGNLFILLMLFFALTANLCKMTKINITKFK